MEYQKIINLLDNTPNQPTKIRTKNCVEINDEERGTFNTNSQIKFKTSMLRSSLFNYSDAYRLGKGAISIKQVGAPAAASNDGKTVVFKNCAPFTDCISEINNPQRDNAKHVDVIMLMYNLIEYSENYSKTSRRLWQYYRDEPAMCDDGAIAGFSAADNSSSFKYKEKITSATGADGTKDIEKMVQLKYLSNFFKES